ADGDHVLVDLELDRLVPNAILVRHDDLPLVVRQRRRPSASDRIAGTVTGQSPPGVIEAVASRRRSSDRLGPARERDHLVEDEPCEPLEAPLAALRERAPHERLERVLRNAELPREPVARDAER